MYQDFKDLLSSFNAHSVKYLIVGGHAVSLHAQPRATKDLDVFIKADSANAHATYAALASWRRVDYGILRMSKRYGKRRKARRNHCRRLRRRVAVTGLSITPPIIASSSSEKPEKALR